MPLKSTAPAPAPTKAVTPSAKSQPLAKPSPPAPKPHVDVSARRQVAGGPTADDVTLGVDSPELRALHDAERELFPPATAPLGSGWPSDLASPLVATEDAPHVHASGLPPTPVPSSPPLAEGGKDLSWLSKLALPDLPVRWDARVVRYLEFFKDDPRGHAMLSVWLRRSGRYRDAIRRSLRRKGVPEDILWLAMIESGFDQSARSPVGAMGLWQFMPETGRVYGLAQDRWVDSRLNVSDATDAAADFLSDLHRRFGSWELAIAAYNMGYGGVASVVHRYNTNDFWALSRLEAALPWETTLYVPKIIAAAIVARNMSAFGFGDLVLDPPIDGEEIHVAPGTALATIAQAAGCSTHDLELRNPELRASRTPPASAGSPPDYVVHVPPHLGAIATANLAKKSHDSVTYERYVVRFGESLDQIASARKVPIAKLIEINAIAPGEVIRGGTTLLVPPSRESSTDAATSSVAVSANVANNIKQPVAVVPSDVFVYPDRKRVFYKVATGDTLRDVATAFHVSVDEVRRWNDLDPVARLQDGMTLQLFVPNDSDLSHVVVLAESDVRVVPVGSDEFFAAAEAMKGRKRTAVTVKAGETLDTIARRYGVSPSSLERINRRARNEVLAEGDTVIVYLPTGPSASAGSPIASVPSTLRGTLIPRSPNGPLPDAPDPQALPPLP